MTGHGLPRSSCYIYNTTPASKAWKFKKKGREIVKDDQKMRLCLLEVKGKLY